MDTGNDMKITKPEENSAGKEKKQSAKMELYDWVQCIVSALVVGILLFVFVGRVVNVRGESMYSTLKDGDKVICSKLFYSPKQGDIVVFRPENNDVFDYSLVKRIVAVEGQTLDIDFDSGTVYIDGEEVYEPYIFEQTYDDEDFTGPMTVPEGKLFVMGDNRNGSTDSRSDLVGFVDKRDIVGKVYWVLLPGADRSGVKDYGRIGSVYKD